MNQRILPLLLAAAATAVGSLMISACSPGTGAPPDPSIRVRHIGFLSGRAPATRDNEFQQGLEELGYVIGENLFIEYRFADGDDEVLDQQAAELVQLGVEVLVASDTQAALAAKKMTATLPIVIVSSGDPVGARLVESLTRPGGNVTGLTSLSVELAAKRLELLKEIAPGVDEVGVMADPSNPVRQLELQQAQVAGQALGVQVEPVFVRELDEVEPAFRAAVADGANAMMVFGDAITTNTREKIFQLTAEYSIPVMYEGNRRVLDGGLISYGSSLEARFRRSAYYVDRILKGAKPADLPVEEPTHFELTVNVRAADALGMSIPASVLARADRIVR